MMYIDFLNNKKVSFQEVETFIDFSDSQLPSSVDYLYYDVEYSEISSGGF